MNIRPERFRILVRKIEKMVDRKNYLNRLKKIFSLTTLTRLKDLGMSRALEIGLRKFTGK
jgi:hypothetical protein